MVIIGIDLATYSGTTGFCILKNGRYRYSIINSDENILEKIKETNPDIIAIDAPLALPKKGLRQAEKDLLKIGIRSFPPLMSSMKKLTKRAIKLKRKLRHYKIIEVYPHAAKTILKLKYKKTHQNDAKICALIGKLYIEGKTISLGNKREGLLVIPKNYKNK